MSALLEGFLIMASTPSTQVGLCVYLDGLAIEPNVCLCTPDASQSGQARLWLDSACACAPLEGAVRVSERREGLQQGLQPQEKQLGHAASRL